MFVLSQDNALFRGIATLVTIALVLWAIGFAYVRSAEAVSVTFVSDTLSTSATSTVSNHTISFVTPSGVATGTGSIVVTFPTAAGEFDLTGVAAGDIDLALSGVDQDLTGTDWSVAIGASTVTFTSVGNGAQPNATATILIGTNAAGGANQITNPDTQGSYVIGITAGADTGETQVAIVNSVYVTANVDTQFDFQVIGNSAGTDVNGTTTIYTATATTIPFGTLEAGSIYTLAQDLTVTTNAVNGFVVTVETDQQLLSDTGADIDGFIDGAYTNTPIGWVAPTPDIDNENSWGHWGLTSEDSDLNGDEFGSNLWVSASTTPRTVFTHNGPADGATPDKGSTTVGYQVEISALQEAADDYRAILTYIATPTF